MPKARARHSIGFPSATVAIIVALAALAIWYATISRDTGRAEPFLSYKNLTAFSDDQVWETYRFALANPGGVLNYIPCFCGCVYHGDNNNRDCYVNGSDAQGRPIFDPHAAGWNICVAITREVMELAERGIPLPRIRSLIDEEFGGTGPSTNTPLPN